MCILYNQRIQTEDSEEYLAQLGIVEEQCGGGESTRARLISTAAMLTDGLKEPYFTP